MRSRTPLDLPGRCHRCYQKAQLCLCAELPSVQTRTHFLLIRHQRETYKSTGTARAAAMAMPNLSLRTYGARDVPLDLSGLEAADTWLLFPCEQGPLTAPPSPPPSQVVVLDGTWAQAKSMVRRVPALRMLPRLHLAPRQERRLRLREPPNPEGMSTLEAIARTVAFLEGDALAQPLEHLHTLWVERCLRGRGKRLDDAWAQLDQRLS
ncbi:MAG: DTW domain-containing protein [Myxococcota bacterium]|nr:DTW domain-containing protein [Myxococcota bacterium]